MSHFPSNMSERGFLEWLRSAAIQGNMPPQFIDRVDDLFGTLSAQEDLDETEAKIDALLESLDEIVTQARDGIPKTDPDTWEETLCAAEALLKANNA